MLFQRAVFKRVMRSKAMISNPKLRQTAAAIGATLLAVNLISTPPAIAGTKSIVFGNGVVLQAGGRLPIYAIEVAPVDAASATQLANRLGATEGGALVQDTVNSHPRYTTVQTATRAVLEQYGATGGIYLYSASRAFREAAAQNAVFDAREAQYRACRYVLENELAPDSVTFSGKAISCNMDFDASTYAVSEVWRARSDADGTEVGREQIGLNVRVPLGIPILGVRAGSYPVGGPGGHISLMFDTTDSQSPDALDEHIAPGITALAAPIHRREFRYLRDAQAVDVTQLMSDIREQLSAAYPGAPITVPMPSLVYWLSDASTPQRALEPVLSFEGAGVEIDGQIMPLKSFTLPATEAGSGGFGATVDITSPASGSRFEPAQPEVFEAMVSGGAAPYTYTWTLGDGTALGGGVLSEAGSITVAARLPAVSHGGEPAAVGVYLSVEDAEGALRGDSVIVIPRAVPQLFLPLAISQAGGAASAQQNHGARAARAATASYGFGTEMASDYPGTGNDLPGVVPDVNGFRSGMAADGWWSGFGWSNSSVWERDFRECQLGGGDCSFGVDRVDFAYYSGHGGPGSLFLPSTQSSMWFSGRNARFDRIRWAAFSSCQTLRVQTLGMLSSEPIRDWFNSFRGSHMLLGFNTNMADVAFGGPFANRATAKIWNLLMPWTQPTIAQAWVQTAFNMNAGKPAYLYAVSANVNPAGDRLPSPALPFLNAPARPLPVGGWAWVWWNGAAREFCPNAPAGDCK